MQSLFNVLVIHAYIYDEREGSGWPEDKVFDYSQNLSESVNPSWDWKFIKKTRSQGVGSGSFLEVI